MSLCPADLHVSRQAMALAAKVGGEVRFVHVVDWLDERLRDSEDELVAIVHNELGDPLLELDREAEAHGIPSSHELREGSPWRELLRAAGDWSADVVAISPRRDGTSRVDRVLHGSTATRVLKKAHCPVWIVDPAQGEVKRVLALVDGSPVSGRVVETARALARIHGAERVALRCLDYPDDIVLQRLQRARQEIERYHRKVRDAARAELQRLTADDEKWTLLLGEDWVVRQAPRLVRDQQIDLVVLGAVSRPRLAGALIGTTAQRLLEHVGVSAWVVHPEGDDPGGLDY